MLSRSSNTPRDTSRMPRSNAGHLAQTTVSLARQTRDSPAGDDSLCASALGHCNGVDHLVLCNHSVHSHLYNRTAVTAFPSLYVSASTLCYGVGSSSSVIYKTLIEPSNEWQHTSFSKRPYAKSTLSAMEPPFTWISIMWAFWNPMFTLRGWVCTSTRMAAACSFSCARLSLISFAPSSYFRAYLQMFPRLVSQCHRAGHTLGHRSPNIGYTAIPHEFPRIVHGIFSRHGA